MKYLQLITKEPLVVANKRLHIRFVYFAENKVDRDTLRTILKLVRSFTLGCLHTQVLGGLAQDVPVVLYSANSPDVKTVYETILKRQPLETRNANLLSWFPCVSYLTLQEVKKYHLETLHVIGIESNDPKDGFRIMFS